MELGDGRGGQLGEEDAPYIVEEQIQPLSTNGTRYYRSAPRYYRTSSRNQNNPEAVRQRAVEPLARYYRSPLRYYRKAGLV